VGSVDSGDPAVERSRSAVCLAGLSSGNWRGALLGSLAQWWCWGLVTPLIVWTDGRLPFKKNQLGMRILAHLLASVALTIFYVYLFIAMRTFFGLSPWSVLADKRFLLVAFRQGLLWSWVVYWVIFGVQQTFRYYQHYLAGGRPADYGSSRHYRSAAALAEQV
jgi:two-component system, LytTR family, sensor kinase